ncbi:MAG: hypothetical protein AAGF93_00560 [Cyanobacteria bacterium P01_H01_bin.105]
MIEAIIATMPAGVSAYPSDIDFIEEGIAWNEENEIFTDEEVFQLFKFYYQVQKWTLKEFQSWLDEDERIDDLSEIVGEENVENALMLLQWI